MEEQNQDQQIPQTPKEQPVAEPQTPEATTGENEITEFLNNTGTWVEDLGNAAYAYLPKLGLAIAIVVIGFWVAKRINRLISQGLERSSLDNEVSSFLSSLSGILMKIIVLLAAASVVGIEVTAILGLLATAGIAVGLALQGSLSNFAAGILIMIFKPYRLGDWVEIEEKFGKVEEIQIFNTKIVSPGHKTLIIPNGQVIEGIVVNYSEKGIVRMELEVTMPYAESFPRVKKIIEDALNTIPEIVKDHSPEIGILTYDSHSIVVAVRPFVKPDDFWEAKYEAYRKIKAAFHNEGIQVAYSEGIELGSIGA